MTFDSPANRRHGVFALSAALVLGVALSPSEAAAADHLAARTVAVTPDKAAAPRDETALRRELVRVSGPIGGSLHRTGLELGVPAAIMSAAIRVFGYGIDFERDIQPGDRFEVTYDRLRDPTSGRVNVGVLRHVSITYGGKTLSLWRFKPKGGPEDGKVDYFNARGESVRMALLRTPVDGARMSSGFGPRKHPILGYTRMHKGIDFAAPRGTPVYAAGDGVVEKAARWGGYGNYIRIRHNDVFATAYAHLAGFAKLLRPGMTVRQGQVIGYVGSTGRSTGPHLHYEVRKNGVAIDPTRLALASRVVLTGKELARFQWYAALMRIRPTVGPDPRLRQQSQKQ